MEKKRVILDTDTGVDDAMAIIFGIKSEALQIEAITTVAGNVDVEKCTRNVLRVLALMNKKVPVGKGCDRPLVKPQFSVPSVHGADGLGDLEEDGKTFYPPLDKSLLSKLHAVDLILESINNHHDEITLVATGPLTNIASAILKDPRTMRKIKEIIVMGGAVNVPGNIPPGAAEFNIYVDPHAAEIVLGFALPLTLVGLDVTHQVRLTRNLVAQELGSKSDKIPQFIFKATEKYMDFYRDNQGYDGCYLHDPLAVGVAIDQSYVKAEEMKIYVETEGKVTSGMTMPFRHPMLKKESPNVSVCVEVDHKRFLSNFLRIAKES